jgi:hypothetical protein
VPAEGLPPAGDPRFMRIEYQQQGGFAHLPGLSRPAAFDSSQLDEAEVRELERLLNEADFFRTAGPASMPAGRRGADVQSYVLTVEDGSRRRTLHATDPVADPKLASLIQFVGSKARSLQRRESGKK